MPRGSTITNRWGGLLCAALVGWGCEGGPRGAPASDPDGAEGATEIAGPGFVLRSPGAGWRLLDGAAASALAPGSLAGAWSDEGAGALLSTQPRGELPLERAVGDLVSKIGLAGSGVERAVAVTIDGREGRRFDAVGEVAGTSLRFSGLVVDSGPNRLHWVAWTSGSRSCAEGACLAPIVEALALPGGPAPAPPAETVATANTRGSEVGGLLDLGTDYALRVGRYDNYRWQLSWRWKPDDWRSPPTAPMRPVAAQQPSATSATADLVPLLIATDPDGEWELTVGATSAGDLPAGGLQPRLAEALRWGSPVGEPRPAQLLDRDALESTYVDGTANDGRQHTLTTVTDSDVVVWLALSGPAEQQTQRASRLASAAAGLSRSPLLVAVETRVDSYVDHRLGFRLKPPSGWLADDRTPPSLAARGRFVRWDQGGRWIGVIAAGGLGDETGAAAISEQLDAMVRSALGPLARATPTVNRTELSGRPARHTQWRGPLLQIDVVATSAKGVAYALISVDRDGRAFEHAAGSFQLVE